MIALFVPDILLPLVSKFDQNGSQVVTTLEMCVSVDVFFLWVKPS